MMSLKKMVHDLFRFFGLKFQRTTSSFGNKLAVYNIEKTAYQKRGDKIYFKELGLEIQLANAAPILERYQNAVQLSKNAGFTFLVNDIGELIAKNQSVQFTINDEEELFILSEVFLEGAYNLISPVTKKIALIDMGMNVGITSLFFASKDNVEKVFSFEPFQPTYSAALKNIQLNESFAHKIKVSNFGLANENGEIYVSYSPKEKGRMGTKGLPRSEGYVAGKVSRELMHLKSADEEILKIRKEIEDNFVVCKIDTEGAEYEIIDSLSNAGLLSFADVYFIEWHEINPIGIIAKLKANNYNVVETTFSLLHSGMLYAFKNHNN